MKLELAVRAAVGALEALAFARNLLFDPPDAFDAAFSSSGG